MCKTCIYPLIVTLKLSKLSLKVGKTIAEKDSWLFSCSQLGHDEYQPKAIFLNLETRQQSTIFLQNRLPYL